MDRSIPLNYSYQSDNPVICSHMLLYFSQTRARPFPLHKCKLTKKKLNICELTYLAIWLQQAMVVVVSLSRHDLRLHTKWSFNRASRHSARVTLQCHGDKVSVIVTIWTETFWLRLWGLTFQLNILMQKKIFNMRLLLIIFKR